MVIHMTTLFPAKHLRRAKTPICSLSRDVHLRVKKLGSLHNERGCMSHPLGALTLGNTIGHRRVKAYLWSFSGAALAHGSLPYFCLTLSSHVELLKSLHRQICTPESPICKVVFCEAIHTLPLPSSLQVVQFSGMQASGMNKVLKAHTATRNFLLGLSCKLIASAARGGPYICNQRRLVHQ